MIDFTLTDNDQARLARSYQEAEFVRAFARDADENEAELPPDTLPGAEEFLAGLDPVPPAGPDDPPRPALLTWGTTAALWGSYSWPAPGRPG